MKIRTNMACHSITNICDFNLKINFLNISDCKLIELEFSIQMLQKKSSKMPFQPQKPHTNQMLKLNGKNLIFLISLLSPREKLTFSLWHSQREKGEGKGMFSPRFIYRYTRTYMAERCARERTRNEINFQWGEKNFIESILRFIKSYIHSSHIERFSRPSLFNYYEACTVMLHPSLPYLSLSSRKKYYCGICSACFINYFIFLYIRWHSSLNYFFFVTNTHTHTHNGLFKFIQFHPSLSFFAYMAFKFNNKKNMLHSIK